MRAQVRARGGWSDGGYTKGHRLAVIHHPVTFPQAGAQADRGATETCRPGWPMVEADHCQYCQSNVA